MYLAESGCHITTRKCYQAMLDSRLDREWRIKLGCHIMNLKYCQAMLDSRVRGNDGCSCWIPDWIGNDGENWAVTLRP